MFGPDGQPVARLRNLGKDGWEVLWWSHRDKWESIGDFGGVVCDDVDEALAYVLDDPMGGILVAFRSGDDVGVTVDR